MLSLDKESGPSADLLKRGFLYEKKLEGPEGSVSCGPPFTWVYLYIKYLYLNIYIFFLLKKNIEGPLFQSSLSEFSKKVPKNQKHSHPSKKRTFYHFFNLSHWNSKFVRGPFYADLLRTLRTSNLFLKIAFGG